MLYIRSVYTYIDDFILFSTIMFIRKNLVEAVQRGKRNRVLKWLTLFFLWASATLLLAHATTIDPTISNAVTYLKQIILTSDGSSTATTWIFLDGSGGRVGANQICNVNGTGCIATSALSTLGNPYQYNKILTSVQTPWTTNRCFCDTDTGSYQSQCWSSFFTWSHTSDFKCYDQNDIIYNVYQFNWTERDPYFQAFEGSGITFTMIANWNAVFTASGSYATTTALTAGLAAKADTSHTHTVSQISDLSSTLNGYATTASLNNYADKTTDQTIGGTKTFSSASGIYANAFLYNSDKRLKTDIKIIENPLDKILLLNWYTFDWKKNGKHDIGVIAQEVEKVFPQIVYTNGSWYKSVSYPSLIAPLIEAVKNLYINYIDQQKEINQLQTEIKEIKIQLK